MKVRRLLHASGLRYLVDWPIPFDRRRHADIVFTRQKVVVFMDGCFWHRCSRHYQPPRTNSDYWDAKTLGNQVRDRDTDQRLGAEGWIVLRFWEHEDPRDVAVRIKMEVAGQRDSAITPVAQHGSALT